MSGNPKCFSVVRRRLKREKEASLAINKVLCPIVKLAMARVLPPGAAQASKIASPG